MKQKCKLHSRQNIYDRVVSSLETIIYYHNLYSWQKKKTICRKTGTLNTPQLRTCSSPLPFPNMGTSSSSSRFGTAAALCPLVISKSGGRDGAELRTSLPHHIYSVEARGLKTLTFKIHFENELGKHFLLSFFHLLPSILH